MRGARRNQQRAGWCGLGLGVAMLLAGCRPLRPTAAAVLPAPEGTVGVLIAASVAEAPVIDGRRESVWDAALAVTIPMTRGLHGHMYAFDLTLRTVHSADTVYFYAEWPGSPPAGAADSLNNRLTMHYEIPLAGPGKTSLNCLAACHSAYTDGAGTTALVRAETVPAAQTAALPAAGGWSEGIWRLEWSRPLREANLYDIQFDTLGRDYIFFVKVFEHLDGQADPVSARYALRFAELGG